MPCKSTPLKTLCRACDRYLELIRAYRRLTSDSRLQQFRHIPQRLWDRHSALFLESRVR